MVSPPILDYPRLENIIPDEEYNVIKSLIENPYGLLLVADPYKIRRRAFVGSILNEIPERRKVTVIENQVGGSAIREALKGDPDVIYVDPVTRYNGKDIINSALTGHLVIGSVSRKSVPEAIGYLYNIGMEPFLMASSLEGVIAQKSDTKHKGGTSHQILRIDYTIQKLIAEGADPKKIVDYALGEKMLLSYGVPKK